MKSWGGAPPPHAFFYFFRLPKKAKNVKLKKIMSGERNLQTKTLKGYKNGDKKEKVYSVDVAEE